jgi:hypothetical protein
MGIANELSSDVAAALLARKDEQSQTETNELIEIVRDFHSAMRELKGEERRRRASIISSVDLSQSNNQATSGGH